MLTLLFGLVFLCIVAVVANYYLKIKVGDLNDE